MEPSYHGDSTARSALRFFESASAADETESFQIAMARDAEGSFTVRANNYTIPTVRTTYAHFCVSRDDILAMNVDLDQDLQNIGFEPFIDARTRQFVHHYVLKASTAPWNSSLSCEEYTGSEVAYVWAPGDVPLNLPANIGAPLGSNGFQSFQLEIHYDNPDELPDQIDDSGIRLYYTSKKREFDLGIMTTGDPAVALLDELVSRDNGLAQHVFSCPSSCSASALAAQQVTVIREYLHMHMSGASMYNYQIRNGKVIRKAGVEYWDFYQQGNMAVAQAPYTLEPGDAFRTTCNYNVQNNETWGLGSQNEMCMAILLYYPRQVVSHPDYGEIPYVCAIGTPMTECEVEHTVTPGFSVSRDLGRQFGTVTESSACLLPTEKPTTSSNDSSDISSAIGHMLDSFLAAVIACSIVIWW